MKTTNGMVVSYVMICQTCHVRYEYVTPRVANEILIRHENNNTDHEVYIVGRARDPQANNEIVEEFVYNPNGVVFG